MITKPNWDQYFLGLAYLISARSPDAETKHGAIIATKDNKIIGTGYNGFVKGMKDIDFPKFRPNKHLHIIHAEINALFNCTVLPSLLKDGAKVYVTGYCCYDCFRGLVQSGIDEFHILKRRSVSTSTKDDDFIAKMVSDKRIKFVIHLMEDINWAKDFIKKES